MAVNGGRLGLGLGVPPLVFGDGLGDGVVMALVVVHVVVVVVACNRLGDGRSESLSGEEGDNGGKSELHFEVFEG